MAYLTEKDRRYKTPEDICAHLGDDYEKYMGAIVPPIFQNSLFVQPTDVNGVEASGYTYTRAANPTVEIAERKIAALEGGDGALCFATGMAAISSAIMHFIRANCHVVLVETNYGNIKTLVTKYLAERYNVSYTFVDGGSIREIENAVCENTSLIVLESPSSNIYRMQDLEKVAEIAKRVGAGTVIDNTYA
ncbi:MAG: PLP-dependent transferase, partial [Clostridia bacterium]|nr:PLP-dependent transferase [Clostridia bacterium]